MLNRIQYNAPVVLTFSLLATVVLFINYATGGALEQWTILRPTFSVTSIDSYLSILFYVLGHSGPDHLIGNLSFILLIGPIAEEKYGSANLLTMFILTAILTGIANLLLFNSGILGASGIVFMLILLVSFANTHEGRIPLTFILVFALYLGKEVMASVDSDNISQFGHIIGGILGSVYGFSGVQKRL